MIHVLQDWTCVEGTGEIEVAQTGAKWLDLSGYQDVTFFTDVSLRTAEMSMHFDTAPALDPVLFKSMASFVVSPTPALVRTQVRLSDNPTTPLAGLVRWRVQSGAGASNPWRVMFRIECFARRARGGA